MKLTTETSVYRVSYSAGAFSIGVIRRPVEYLSGASGRYVFYRNKWRLVHRKEELERLLEETRALTKGGGTPTFENRRFQLGRDVRLPFVKMWEPPLER